MSAFAATLIGSMVDGAAAAAVEPRGYLLELLASTGIDLTSIDSRLSINDQGVVAFAGQDAQASKLFVVSAPGDRQTIALFGTTRQFAGAAINDGPPAEVVTRERVSGSPPVFLVRKWRAYPPYGGVVLGRTSAGSFCTGGINAGQACTTNADCGCFLNPFCTPGVCQFGASSGFQSATPFVGINDFGTAVFTALTNDSTTLALFAAQAEPPRKHAEYASIFQLRPQNADSSRIVATDDQGRVVTYDPQPFGPAAQIFVASQAGGFTEIGQQPGIAHDGATVAFSAVRDGLRSVFVAFPDRPPTAQATQVLTEGDVTAAGFLVESISMNERVGIATAEPEAGVFLASIVFVARVGGRDGVYERSLRLHEGQVVRSEVRPVAIAGDVVGGKTLATFALYDPMTRFGDVAIYSTFSGGGAGIVRAKRGCRLLFVDAGHGALLTRGTCSNNATRKCNRDVDCIAPGTCNAPADFVELDGRRYKYERPVIGVDGTTIVEDLLTLSIAGSVSAGLGRRTPPPTVELTRTDKFPPAVCGRRLARPCIKSRVGLANRKGANAFISVHTNSGAPSLTANGVETLYNDRGPYGSSSEELARTLTAEIHDLGVRLRGSGITTRWGEANRHTSTNGILGGAEIPAVIVEVAFHSNTVLGMGQSVTDASRLADPVFREAAGEAIARGVADWCDGVLR